MAAPQAPTNYAPPDAVQFLRAMYARAPSGSWVEMRCFAPDWGDAGLKRIAQQWRTWTSPSEPERIANQAHRACAAGIDVYQGVALRRARGGEARDVVAVTALWAELDGGQSAKGHGCSSKDAAWERLRQIEIVAPSIIVDSGGGFHVYWLLEEPITGDELACVPIYNARLREALRLPGAAPGAGYAGDVVSDLPRILRIPGTSNQKIQGDLRPVRLVECDAEARYSLQHLDANIPALPAHAFARGGGGAVETIAGAEMGWTPELEARRAQIVSDCAGPWSAAAGERHFLPHPIARVLLNAGWPWQDIPTLVGDIAQAGGSNMPDDRQRDAYRELTSRIVPHRVGWPWLRTHVPDLADALGRYLNPQTDDLAALCAAVHGAPAVDEDTPAPAIPAPPLPAPPAPAPASSNVHYLPGLPSIEQLAAMQQQAPSVTVPTERVPVGTPPAAEPSAKPAKEKADKAPKDDSKAIDKVYDLLRGKLAWLGKNKHDQRLYAGKRSFDGARGVELIETIELEGVDTRRWALSVMRAAGLTPNKTNRDIALELLAYDASQRVVDIKLRFALAPDGAWLVDLGDNSWQYGRLHDGMWSIESSPEPVFVRSVDTLPMPRPEIGMSPQDLIDGLQSMLGYDDDVCERLACWLPQAMHPDADRLGLLLTGPSGSGKSFAARTIRTLLDPAVVALVAFEQKRGEVDYRQFAVDVSTTATLCYDNVSSIGQQASDMLCGFMTGTGRKARKLQTDADPTIRTGRSGLVMTGISITGMGTDLQDRLMHLALPRRSSTFGSESELRARLLAELPRLTGALLSTTAQALAIVPEIRERYAKLLAKCRMLDAATMYAATAHVLGLDAEQMLLQLLRERANAQGADFETDIVGERINKLISARREYSPGATIYFDDELSKLSKALLGDDRPPTAWPQSPQTMRAKLDKMINGMELSGIKVLFYKSTSTNRRHVKIVQCASELDLGADDTTVLPLRFGSAERAVTEMLDHVGCLSEPVIERIAAGKVPGLEPWQGGAQGVMALGQRERARVINAVARRHVVVELPAPASFADPVVRWIEARHDAQGIPMTTTWHAWLMQVADIESAVPF